MKMDYSSVESYCSELEASLRRIHAVHDDCEAQMRKIKGGSIWGGPASEGFVSRLEKTMTTCRIMEQSLLHIINYIRSCVARYKSVDDSIISMMKDSKF